MIVRLHPRVGNGYFHFSLLPDTSEAGREHLFALKMSFPDQNQWCGTLVSLVCPRGSSVWTVSIATGARSRMGGGVFIATCGVSWRGTRCLVQLGCWHLLVLWMFSSFSSPQLLLSMKKVPGTLR